MKVLLFFMPQNFRYYKKKLLKKSSSIKAEREGFEPPVVLPTSVFKTGALSQTLPSLREWCKSKK